ncbi:MAG TPA: hypothetical protein VGX68_05045 [Thermoanaerobaculia bacterium]|jgi:hypothetical protein|nr:hypothetical protein [Thermoanaerobaculia bacterium]
MGTKDPRIDEYIARAADFACTFGFWKAAVLAERLGDLSLNDESAAGQVRPGCCR